MPRRARGPIPAGVYHVWRRTCGPTEMFRDDVDRTMFCNRLAATIRTYDWTLSAFVLMPTHFHLIAEVADDILSRVIHGAFGPYAQEFNRRHGRKGHLRAEPFKLRPIADDADLANAARYVLRNPVRAGLCEKPQDWYWSSYRGSAGYAEPFPFVDDRTILAFFDEDRTKAIREFRVFVESL